MVKNNDSQEFYRVSMAMLKPNAIFVFGSNRAGRHGAGAALTALRLYGARSNIGVGPQGRAYALPTKGRELETLPLIEIAKEVNRFKTYAKLFPEFTYVITRIGCGLAGYDDTQIAPMFENSPENCLLPIEWKEIIDEYTIFSHNHNKIIGESIIRR